MYDNSPFLDASGNLNHEAVRAHFLRTGKLEGLQRGDVVYVEIDGRWRMAELLRRLPGDVWTCDTAGPPGTRFKTIVMCSNFGGKVAK